MNNDPFIKLDYINENKKEEKVSISRLNKSDSNMKNSIYKVEGDQDEYGVLVKLDARKY